MNTRVEEDLFGGFLVCFVFSFNSVIKNLLNLKVTASDSASTHICFFSLVLLSPVSKAG